MGCSSRHCVVVVVVAAVYIRITLTPPTYETTMGIRKDDIIVVETPGGGGWGLPE